MSQTPLLLITQVAPSQNNKETTINDGFLKVERSLNDSVSVDFTSGDVTLNTSDATSYGVFICTNAAAPHNLIVPQSKRIFGVKNDTSSTITVKTAATGTPTTTAVEGNTRALLYCDGTNVHYFASGSQPGGLFYDLGFQFIGVPGNSEKQEFLGVRAFTLPTGATNSAAKAGVAATALTTLSIQKNSVEIGTIAFAAASATGTFTVSAGVTFASGDMLSIVTPLSPDATLADIAITLACSR